MLSEALVESLKLVMEENPKIKANKFQKVFMKEAADLAGEKMPWKDMEVFKVNSNAYDLTSFISENDSTGTPEKPAVKSLPVDLGSIFFDADEEDEKENDEQTSPPVFKKTEPLPKKKETSIDKYDDEFRVERNPVRSMANSVITVSTFDGFIYGICRTFEKAWEIKYKVIHDCGEGNFDVKKAEREFMKKGFLVIRSENSQQKVILEHHPLLS